MNANLPGRFLALAGLRQAVDDTLNGHGYRHVTAGTGAFWACVLDEQIRKTSGGPYVGIRDADSRGIVVHGLRLVRNGIAHGAHFMTDDGGFTFPITFPLIIPGPAWRPLDEILAAWTPMVTKDHDKQLSAYRERMAGRGPHEPLEEALDFFERLAAANWQAKDMTAA